MPFEIIRADITQLKVDGIVNAANETLLGGGGVDGAIHKAAGPELLEACKKLGGCRTGEAKLTHGYNLPAHYVIHTVGPVWRGGDQGEEEQLRACYTNALEIAHAQNMESLAFPLISTGIFGYPKDLALKIALSVISNFLMQHELMIYLVVYDHGAFALSEKLFNTVKAYIDDHYIEENFESLRMESHAQKSVAYESEMPYPKSILDEATQKTSKLSKSSSAVQRRLKNMFKELEETFSEHLLRLIDIKGKSDVEVYKKANIDRKLFSKIRGDKTYKPSKSTALAFAIALELNLDETKDLLKKAGFALSNSSKFDLIITYFISENNFNIFEINETLFAFEQPLLGVNK